jgi:LmbE family N-acetylglucosaminyl deacetylase
MLFLIACRFDENLAIIESNSGSICAVLAHPDDETIISGTLAMLSSQGFDLTVVYVTSGDDGPDETGNGLHGKELAEVREKEAINSLQAIGITTPPVFLRYPDGHVHENVDSVQQKLTVLLDAISPDIVIGFGPEGITGDGDHKSTGIATDLAFDQTVSGKLLLHMAITKPFPPFYANGVAVPRNTVDVRIRVSRYFRQRTLAVEAHQTQFNNGVRSAYKIFVHAMRKEKFIIARHRNAN